MDAYQLAEKYSNDTNRCLFITGKAGTGKTTFLKQLRKNSYKNMVVVAPTGVAAINASGVTIHSFFQLPIHLFEPTQNAYKQLISEQRIHTRKRKILFNLELLVIDEVSMVRADLLDAIDAVLRHYKCRPNHPFGGVQVIFIGDLFQLSPVIKPEEEKILRQYYDGYYFFNSNVIKQINLVYIELDHIFRQKDYAFVKILNEVRDNKLSDEGKALLLSRYNHSFENRDNDFHIHLTTHNNTAAEINKTELQKIKSPVLTFTAKIEGNFPENLYPNDLTLKLKIGAKVMFIRNDEGEVRRFYNGKIGEIIDINEENQIIVKCEEENICVSPMRWENIKYEEDLNSGKINEVILGTFSQYPLRLAWAITIHKSQGLTFDKVIIDAQKAFAAGQVYVALSRCRTLEGIVLSTPLYYVKLENDQRIINYTNSQPQLTQVESLLPQAHTEYKIQLFTDIYDFSRLYSQIERLQYRVSASKSFNKATKSFLKEVINTLNELVPISEKFSMQLTKLILSYSDEILKQRLKASINYYEPKINSLIETIQRMPCRSHNKQEAMDFVGIINDFYLQLKKKIESMKSIANEPTVQNCLKSLSGSNFKAIELEQVYITNTVKKSFEYKTDFSDYSYDSPFVQLVDELEIIRELTEENKLEIAARLPRTRQNLEKLKSLDKELIHKHGSLILAIVNNYIDSANIHPVFIQMLQKSNLRLSKKKAQADIWKIEEEMQLEQLYLEGKTIQQMMDILSKSKMSIEKHLKKLKLI